MRRLYSGDKVILFVFLLSTLLLFSPKQFESIGIGDGFIEYEVARRMVESGAVDLPQHKGWRDARIQEGRGGRYFSWFGLGQSVLFVVTVAADKSVLWVTGLLPQSWRGPGFFEPFFFSKSANALVLAVTGVCIFTLLKDLGLSWTVSTMTCLLYAFGSTALVYSTQAFDISLSVLLLLAAFLCLFRAVDRGSPAYWISAGMLLGFSLLTRVTAIIFFIPAAAFILAAGPRPYFRGRIKAFVLLAAGILPFALLFLYYNHHRFGSFFYTGYDSETSRYGFTASLSESIPALLLSPGRSIFVFSPILVLSLFGVPAFIRAGRAKALAVLLAALVNVLFFARWNWWATPLGWGLRYQLPAVALMFIPLGYCLEERWMRGSRPFRVFILAACALCVLLQLLPAVGGYSRAGSDYWSWRGAQLPAAAGRLAAIVSEGRWEAARPWWTAPEAHSLLIKLLLAALLAASVVSLAALCGIWRKRALSEGSDLSN